jgi:hypothetical protein
MPRFTRKKHRVKIAKQIYIGETRDDKCIFIDLMTNEGLGNQLYIYAAGLTVKKKTGLPLCIVPSKGNTHSKKKYTSLFNGKVIEINKNKKRYNNAKIVLSRTGSWIDSWTNNNITYNNSNKGNNVKIATGLYQNYNSVKDVIPQIKDILMNKEFNKDKYRQYDNVKSDNTAFIHIRRGDYPEKWRADDQYFINALTKINDNSEIITIYVFSVDNDWNNANKDKLQACVPGKNLDFTYATIKDELQVLYIMSLCLGGAIISPSTFSSWGAMLGPDTNKRSTIIYQMINNIYPGIVNPYSFPERWIAL